MGSERRKTLLVQRTSGSDRESIPSEKSREDQRELRRKVFSCKTCTDECGGIVTDNVRLWGFHALWTDYQQSPSNIFGAAAHYKYLWIVYCTQKDQWNYYRGGRKKIITRQEAVQRAKEIRDLIVRGATIIEKHKSPNSLADYRFLEQDLSSIFIYSYTWALKYFQMLYPEWFPCMYGDHTLVRAIGIIGLPEHGDRYLNLGEIALFTKKCRIPNVLLSHIYGVKWGWTETLKPCENDESNFANSHLSVSEYNRRNA